MIDGVAHGVRQRILDGLDDRAVELGLGAVELQVTGAPKAQGYCHCTSCRTWSAGPVNAFSLWDPAAVKITKGADNLSWQAGLERYTFGADTPSIVWQTYDTGSYINFGGVNLPGGVQDPTLQKLIDQAKVETDRTKAKALFSQISAQVDKDALTVRLPWQNNVMAYRNRVQDFHVLTAFEYPLQFVWVNDGK